MRPSRCILAGERGRGKSREASTGIQRISVPQPCKSSTGPCHFRIVPSCLRRRASELTRPEGLNARDSWHTTHPPAHNQHALLWCNSFDCLGAFSTVRPALLLQPHARSASRSPRSAATLAVQFSRSRAHETTSSIPGATGPCSQISPVAQTCTRRESCHVMPCSVRVVCVVPQPAVACCCECLWAAGEGSGDLCQVLCQVDLVHKGLASAISTPTYY